LNRYNGAVVIVGLDFVCSGVLGIRTTRKNYVAKKEIIL